MQEISFTLNNINTFTDENKCNQNIHSLGSFSELNNHWWAKKIFSVQKINNTYIYWVYGVHIPFFQKNKILILRAFVNKDSTYNYLPTIKLDSENRLKSFAIIDSHSYEHRTNWTKYRLDLRNHLSINVNN